MKCIYCIKFRNDLEFFAKRLLYIEYNNNLEVSYYEENYEKNSICYECLALMFYGAWKYTDGGDIRTFNLKSHLYFNYELFYYLAVMKYNMKYEKEHNIKNLNIIKDKFDEMGIYKMVESYF